MSDWFWIPIFVYGTLKRGEVREGSWPHAPTRIAFAHLQGLIYDLGPYPAIRDGDGWVGGELWFIAEEHMPRTLKVLDQIEGYSGQPDDLYVRRTTTCWIETDSRDLQEHAAYTYFYGDPTRLDPLAPIAPDPDGRSRWFGRD